MKGMIQFYFIHSLAKGQPIILIRNPVTYELFYCEFNRLPTNHFARKKFESMIILYLKI